MKSTIPKEVVEAFIFANTPAYLYRKLTATSFIDELYRKSDDELIQLLNLLSNEKLNYISAAYAVFIVVIDRDSEKATAIKTFLAKMLEWSNILESIHDQEKNPPTTQIAVRMPSFSLN